MISFLKGVWETFLIMSVNIILTPVLSFILLLHTLSTFVIPLLICLASVLVYGRLPDRFEINTKEIIKMLLGIVNIWFITVFCLLKETPKNKSVYLFGSSLSIIFYIIGFKVIIL